VRVIQALHTLVVDFTSRLIHQSIVLREHELATKMHTKVWRLSTGPVRGACIVLIEVKYAEIL
jgi:hypothetical protein